MRSDPIEKDPRFRAVIEDVDAAVEAELADVPHTIGFCHQFWHVRKRILQERYGIHWRTPAEMNPDTRFD